MEKWKILVIIGLLAALPVYGYLQNKQATAPPTAAATPTPPPVTEMVGQPAPAWSIPAEHWANTAKPIRLEDVTGSVTLLEFWRAECSHCQEAAPFIESLHEKYGPKGLRIIGFQSPNVKNTTTVEHRWNDVKVRAKEWGIKYPIAFDKDAKVFGQYKCALWPSFVVMDRKGIVRYGGQGFTPQKAQELVNAIEKELGIKSSTTAPAAASPQSAPAAAPQPATP